MSRLIIKNLPNTINTEKLKEHFSTKGVVTDVQLKYTSNGKFRHFGFIGFETAEAAERAKDYFHNTFISQSKISVEICTELGDTNKPKAWSKYASDSSAYKRLHSNQDVNKANKEPLKVNGKKTIKKNSIIDPVIAEQLKKHRDDPMFLEFLEVHSKKVGGDSWRNILLDKDSGVDEEGSDKESNENKTEEDLKKSSAFSAISDLEYLKLKKKQSTKSEGYEVTKEEKSDNKQLHQQTEKFFVVKVTNLAFSTKKKELKDFFHPLKPASVRLPPKTKGFAYVSFKTIKEVKKALNKNKSFLKGKQIIVKEYIASEEKEQQSLNNIKNENQKRWKEQEEALMREENVAESGSIFVRNLPYTVSQEQLTELFESFGPLADVTMSVDRITRKMKGFATMTFVMPEHAVQAYSKLDGTVFHGRMLHLLPAKTKPSPDEGDSNKSYKDKKGEKEKATAGHSYNWNTLFLGLNAVAEIMADTYNMSKQDVLTGSDVAVRLALGETQIVSATKQFLLDNGVSLDAFNQPAKVRSKTVILVKNLPARTTAAELAEKFKHFGELGRVVLPPSGVTAIVEFLEPSEAKKAFMASAYTPFKHLPLYLEWAPDNTFSTVKEVKPVGDSNNGEQASEELPDRISDDDDIQPEPDTTLYVKNLNFNTTENSLKKHFNVCGRVASVTVAHKKDPAHPGQLLSMGYGFVQLYKQAQVNEALKRLQHSILDGHTLELKRSNRTLQVGESRKKSNVEKQTGTKILVRNIPFQATHKELLQLLKTFGEIKTLRLPKKMVGTGSHRGFAFVEFLTKHDAKRAMQALCQSTHLFGRRLVLEWAQVSEDIEELRKRTAKSFQPGSAPRTKKSRADIEIQDDEELED